ncbi:hypothetical protein PCASD_19758 [Puccinia coronata f. sp. avenae]|uniref:Reverse transcriptase Ty1/copia-type domain-containing protein n=1 Tax=Puccinia coronata f. sp. avenae TaxID=200324 RepID=A0A2N5TUI3_9BASI|nr:hypothetical protein PCASD_19758 [Puccinia coronata f. sp. avenae]
MADVANRYNHFGSESSSLKSTQPKELAVKITWSSVQPRPVINPALPMTDSAPVESTPLPIPSSPPSVKEWEGQPPPPSPSSDGDLTFISLPDLPPLPPSPIPSPPPQRVSTRQRKPPERLGHWAKAAEADPAINTPKTWCQLLKSPNKHQWLKAADNEFALLLGMQTWKLVPRPQKQKIIKSKWVFKIKRRPNQSIQKVKARLVAMGYSQVHGLDYDKVFSPTLRQETLWLIFSLLASRNWKGRQVDFKTAFLNGHLDTPIFMEQPPGFEDPQHPDWVCEVGSGGPRAARARPGFGAGLDREPLIIGPAHGSPRLSRVGLGWPGRPGAMATKKKTEKKRSTRRAPAPARLSEDSSTSSTSASSAPPESPPLTSQSQKPSGPSSSIPVDIDSDDPDPASTPIPKSTQLKRKQTEKEDPPEKTAATTSTGTTCKSDSNHPDKKRKTTSDVWDHFTTQGADN